MNFGPYNLNIPSRLVFKDVSLTTTNFTNHIWGKNGVGKSTLMNEIVKECDNKSYKFAYINQNYRQNWLWWYSLADNLELAVFGKLPNVFGRRKSLSDYKFMDLPQVKSQMYWLEPLLYSSKKQIEFDTESEISTVDLSGGQLQRVILLRELLRKPDILLLDEAFSALDKKVLPEILSWLADWQKEFSFTIISIAHDRDILTHLLGDIFELSLNTESELEINKVVV